MSSNVEYEYEYEYVKIKDISPSILWTKANPCIVNMFKEEIKKEYPVCETETETEFLNILINDYLTNHKEERLYYENVYNEILQVPNKEVDLKKYIK